MLAIIETVARLICEVKPYNSSFGNLLVKLYILFVNFRASCQTGKSSNDFMVDKYLNLRFINLPIDQSANQRTICQSIQSSGLPVCQSANQD